MKFIKLIAGWFGYGRGRKLSANHITIFSAIAIVLAIYQVWSVIWGKLDPLHQMALHLSFILALTFLLYGYSNKVETGKNKDTPTFLDYTFTILAIAAGIHFTFRAEWIATRIPLLQPLEPLDIIFGLVFIILTIEAARRTIGFPIIAIILIGFSYTLWGHHLSGIWYHREFHVTEFIDELAYSYNGLWGSPIAVAATFVFMFLLFGAFLKQAGAGEFFFNLSVAIAGRTRGGAAKVTVLASAFLGSISGSPTANVVTTGPFTIPVSKRSGYKPSVAAAIEATASTGGSILPPIMGSSAFLMAAVTQIPYGQIALAAFIPAVLYYASLLFIVHIEAVKTGLPRPKEENIPRVKDVLKEGWFYFIPFLILVFLLMKGFSPSRTAFYAILSIIVVSWFKKESRIGIKQALAAMVDGARSSIAVTAACGAAGLIIAGIMSTGLGGKLTSIVLGLTDGILVPTLILTMVICLILGMGMPVAAAYILTAMLAAPALIELGVSQIQAHLFIVYYSIFSAITPPVAVAAYAAAGIAGENPNRVSLEAVRLGMIGFVIPFMFVLQPALLLEGSTVEIAWSVFIAMLGIYALASGIVGWLMTSTNKIERTLLILSGVLFIYPNLLLHGIAVLLIALVFFIQHKRKVVQPAPSHTQ